MKMKYFKNTLRDNQGNIYFQFVTSGGTKTEIRRMAEYDAKQAGRIFVKIEAITQREFDHG